MITKIRLQNWKSFRDSTIYIDSLGILIGTNASGKSNVLDAFAFLRAVGDGKSLLDAIQTVRGGEDWIIRRGENTFCIEAEIETEEGNFILDLRVIKRILASHMVLVKSIAWVVPQRKMFLMNSRILLEI